MPDGALAIGIDDVRAAARRLAGRLVRTPVVRAPALDRASGLELYLKCEPFQTTGSFKARGALNRLLQLDAAERARGVVAFSSGNHAQAVAWAAREVGTTAVVCMPTDAPEAKVAATRAWGAVLVRYDRLVEDRETLARKIAADSGRAVVPPFDDPAIMAGQGTAALELCEDVPGLDALVTPVGGGGLLSGCATAAAALRPGIRIFGVEAEGADDVRQSLEMGRRVTIPPPTTIADGIRTTSPGALTFPVLQAFVEELLLVSDAEIVSALRALALDGHVVAEPTGAVGLAAGLAGRMPLPAGARVGVVISGGNVDGAALARMLG